MKVYKLVNGVVLEANKIAKAKARKIRDLETERILDLIFKERKEALAK